MTEYYTIIPAAGSGERFGSDRPKQYHSMDGEAILDRSIAPFLQCEKIRKIVVVVNDDYPSTSDKILTALGGATRMASVNNGLSALQDLAEDNDWVLVHDGVRPFLTINDVEKLINVVGDHPVGGILGVPVKDTVKKINEKGEIISTIDRRNLWHAFTPQMFRYGLLKEALQNANELSMDITDESSAIELLGLHPIIVQGQVNNTKITFADDLKQPEEV